NRRSAPKRRARLGQDHHPTDRGLVAFTRRARICCRLFSANTAAGRESEFHFEKIAHRVGFGDLAGSIGGDGARSYRWAASMRRMWIYYQFIERAVCESCGVPVLRWSISAPQ